MSSGDPGSEGPPDLDVGRILETLDRHGVTYLIVGGIDIRLISLDDLIASKEAADRDKDHEALPELRELRRDD